MKDTKFTLKNVQTKTLEPFHELSYRSWDRGDSGYKTSFWIFQCNPKFYNIVEALNDRALQSWRVNAHDKEIKIGDKIIFWITGNNQGCYALGEVSSDIYIELDDYDNAEVKYYTNKVDRNSAKRVKIKITHNLSNNPITRQEIEHVDKLLKIKVGNQGTNFTATEEEFNALHGMAEKRSQKRYWLYAPGENAELWDEFYSNDIIGLGWDELGDLSNYVSKEDLKVKLQEIENTTGSKKNDTIANYEFKDIMSIDDIVIAKKGRGELLGYGVVTSDYYYDNSRSTFQKCRKVNWIKKGNWKVDQKLALKTLTDITKYPSEHPDYDKYYERLLGIMENTKLKKNYRDAFSQWLDNSSQIDSGKNSSYIRAIDLLSERSNSDLFEEDDLNKLIYLYEDLKKEQSVVGGKYYNSSAPSYGTGGFYSAAVKSYKTFLGEYLSTKGTPQLKTFNGALNKILYGPPGTGKTYRLNAIKEQYFTDKNIAKTLEDELMDIIAPYPYWKIFAAVLYTTISPCSVGKIFEHPIVKAKFSDNVKSPQNSIWRVLQSYADQKSSQINEKYRGTFQLFTKNSKSEWSIIDDKKDDLVNIVGQELLDLAKNPERFPEKSQKNKIRYNFITFHQKYSYEDFIEGIKPLLQNDTEDESSGDLKFELKKGIFYKSCLEALKLAGYNTFNDCYNDNFENRKAKFTVIKNDPTKQYALLIDEINRANISAVFGELITLLEKDKRMGAEYEMWIELPYSNEKFCVPSNLYIIGTMNTADRSIALLDIALRRRFEFEALYPIYPEDEWWSQLLENLNQAIYTIKKNPDFFIGHAFFIGKNETEKTNIFNANIIPLLNEYCQNNSDTVRQILVKTGIQLKQTGIKENYQIIAE